MAIPLFPSLTPRYIDPLWFNIDKSSNDEAELIQLEHEHRNWLTKISQKDSDVIPIGKTATEREEEEEEEEEEDDDTNDDEESETQDDEDDDMEVDVSYNRDPPPSNE